jgi:hypothetical protein
MEYYDDDGPEVETELSQLAWKAGYGAALMRMQQENSSDAAGDRILAAADQIRGVAPWGDDAESWDQENGSSDDDGWAEQ